MKKRVTAFFLGLLFTLGIIGCSGVMDEGNATKSMVPETSTTQETTSLQSVEAQNNFGVGSQQGEQNLDFRPVYSGQAYEEVNNNTPTFAENEITTGSYEFYSELDSLGRCGVAMACIGPDIMPTEERGSIGQVKPTGWQTVKYDNVDGKYLYNRCHLIGYQLTGENANEKNLITGTRYLNVEGMLPFENMVADYVKETGNHCMYRVTPVFEGSNLLASGVYMEAYSVEDAGEGISFYVYAYNMQPGISIDYATGNSSLASETTQADQNADQTETYVLNTNTM